MLISYFMSVSVQNALDVIANEYLRLIVAGVQKVSNKTSMIFNANKI